LVAYCADRWAVAPKAAAPPTVDGQLDEPVWREAAVLQDFRIPYFTTPAEESVSVKVAYDDDAVYFGLSYSQPAGALSLTGFEILLSPSSDGGSYFRVPVVARAVKPPYNNNWGNDITTVDDAVIATKIEGTGVTAEVEVPLSSLGGPDVTTGSEWRVNVLAQHEMMTAPLSSWLPIRRSVNMYSGGGAVVQAEVTAEALLGSLYLNQLPGGASAWSPRDVQLEYTGFTEKTLSFYRGSMDPRDQLSLRWKSVAEPWVDISAGPPSVSGDRMSVSFSHPAPASNGLCQLQVIAQSPGARGPVNLTQLTFDRDSLIHAGDRHYDLNGGQS
jgi:hypothetical protein